MTDKELIEEVEVDTVTEAKKKNTFIEYLKEFSLCAVVAVVFSLILNSMFMVNQVVGDSMYPTFVHGEKILSTKFNLNDIKHGDIIMIHSEVLNEDIIKRVVALPGDKISYVNNVLTVNDEVVNEDYLNTEEELDAFVEVSDLVLQEDQYFVLGDNRNHSSDSRTLGVIKKSEIFGLYSMDLFGGK